MEHENRITLQTVADPKAALFTTGPLMVLLPMGTVFAIKGVAFLSKLMFPTEVYSFGDFEVWGGILAFLIGAGMTSVAMVLARNTIVRVNEQDAVVWVQKGLFTLDHNYIPMQQIVDIDLRQDLLERMLGLSSISILTIRRERIIVRYLKNGMNFTNELMGIIQANGGLMKPTGWIVDQ